MGTYYEFCGALLVESHNLFTGSPESKAIFREESCVSGGIAMCPLLPTRSFSVASNLLKYALFSIS